MNRNMGHLVANHLSEQLGVLGLKESGVDADSTRRGFTAAERTAETPAGFDPDPAGKFRDAPDRGPFREPAGDWGGVRHRS